MLAEAKAPGDAAINMTDHGNMFAPASSTPPVKADITPIIGIEAYIAPGSRFDTKRITWGDPSQKSDDVSASGIYLHITTMVAENATGLRNLFKLSSLASFEGQLASGRGWTRRSSPNTRPASSPPRAARRGGADPARAWATSGKR